MLLVPCHPPLKNGAAAARPGGFAMCAGPQNDDFFFASSKTFSERKGRRQCKTKSKEQKLMFSQSTNPYFPGGYQLARSRMGAILSRGTVGSRYPFWGMFF